MNSVKDYIINKRLVFYYIVFFCFFKMYAYGSVDSIYHEKISTDSLMNLVYNYGNKFHSVDEVKADAYTSFIIYTKRKNTLTRWIPGLFKFEQGEQHYEGLEHLKINIHNASSVDAKRIAFYCNRPILGHFIKKLKGQYLLNIYQSNLFSDHLLSPLNKRNKSFYKFRYRESFIDGENFIVQIEVIPKFINTQLVAGIINIDSKIGRVIDFDFNFHYDLISFRLKGKTGDAGLYTLYPKDICSQISVNFLGNRLTAVLNTSLKYKLLSRKKTSIQSKYNLSDDYRLRTDTQSVNYQKSYFDSVSYLSSQKMFIDDKSNVDTLHLLFQKHQSLWNRVETFFNKPIGKKGKELDDILFDRNDIRFKKGHIVFPPILAPEMLQWSKRKSFFLQTKTKLEWNYSKKIDVLLNANIGYSFRQKRIEWIMPLKVVFHSKNSSSISIETNGGNYLFSDVLENQYNNILLKEDTIVKGAFSIYKNKSLNIRYNVEPFSGFTFSLGGNYDRRKMLENSKFYLLTGHNGLIKSLSLSLDAEWTPFEYYYIFNDYRKSLYSYWPTFRFNYTRGLNIGYNNNFEKIEFDLQYVKSLYALRALYIRFGLGFYTNLSGRYFLAYDYFNDKNIIEKWQDEMSGKFFLLSSHWYNDSPYYYRLGFTYESPMLLLSRLNILSPILQKERLYVNMVTLRPLYYYTELGYGISTNIADVGGFISIGKKIPTSFGLRIIFRWFNKW